MPLSIARLHLVGQTNFGQGNVVNTIDAQADRPNDVNNVTWEITQALSARHRSLDFNVTSQQNVFTNARLVQAADDIFVRTILGQFPQYGPHILPGIETILLQSPGEGDADSGGALR